MATDYNDGKWHGWNGGECPVHEMSVVEAVWHDPNLGKAGMTGPRLAIEAHGPRLAWSHVVKFRVIKPYRAPREWWVNLRNSGENEAFPSREIAGLNIKTDHRECVRVREVTDE